MNKLGNRWMLNDPKFSSFINAFHTLSGGSNYKRSNKERKKALKKLRNEM
jgi:hypothetical protein